MTTRITNQFFESTHTVSFRPQVIDGKVRPYPLRPFAGQKILAEGHPLEFGQAICNLMVAQRPCNGNLCQSVFSGKPCLKRVYCTDAGSLAEFYASQISKYPFYKTTLCRFVFTAIQEM
jgi:hypothetical protein